MSFPLQMPQLRRIGAVAAAALFAAGVAQAQSNTSSDTSSSNTAISSHYSSSQSGLSQMQLAEFSAPKTPTPGGSAAFLGGAGAGQYGGEGEKQGLLHRWTFEAGAGFNAPIGNDIPYITWGGNFTVGAGLRFNKWVSALAEYQFMDNKLPGAFLAGEGVNAGNAHINSITGSPVIDLFPKKSNGVYLVGGWGYYHKSTNFNDYECCDYYGYDVAVTVASITSNQWGGNAGLGIYHRLGSMYGDSHSEVFAEARYTFIHTPPVSQTNGLGTTELIPVTLGIRF